MSLHYKRLDDSTGGALRCLGLAVGISGGDKFAGNLAGGAEVSRKFHKSTTFLSSSHSIN